MTRVLLHPFAGVLSAYGMGLADVRALRQQAVEARLSPEELAAAEPVLEALERAARDEVGAQGISPDRVTAKRTLHLKYEGTDTTLETACASVPTVVVEFERRYRQHYGFLMTQQPMAAVAREVIEAYGDASGWAMANPVGTGPYRLAQWRRGQKIVLEANPRYREEYFPDDGEPGDRELIAAMKGKRLPQAGRVEISIIEESNPQLLAFDTRELDYMIVE